MCGSGTKMIVKFHLLFYVLGLSFPLMSVLFFLAWITVIVTQEQETFSFLLSYLLCDSQTVCVCTD